MRLAALLAACAIATAAGAEPTETPKADSNTGATPTRHKPACAFVVAFNPDHPERLQIVFYGVDAPCTEEQFAQAAREAARTLACTFEEVCPPAAKRDE